jgi:hypothetical protein
MIFPKFFISSIFSFYLSPLLMMVTTHLNIVYSFSYREYINHIHLLNFLFYPHPLICNLLLVWPVFIFVLRVYSTYERNVAFSLLQLANLRWCSLVPFMCRQWNFIFFIAE